VEDVERTAKEHLARRDYEGAATVALEAYGPEILGFLVAIHRDRLDAGDVFSAFCEDFWTALPRFRGEASLRTWAYTLARHASAHFFREPHRRRASALSNHPELQELEERIRTRTPSFLGKSTRDLVSELRQQLTADEQMLLILRVDRDMPWDEVASVMETAAPVLRKRFERVKARLRKLVDEAKKESS
jgi:RNA polymerase sigma-70 factor (ECF subfamily)